MTDAGEIVHVVVQLRKLLTAYDGCSFVLRDDLSVFDERVEDLAIGLRPQLQDTANGVAELLERLEATPQYQAARRNLLNE